MKNEELFRLEFFILHFYTLSGVQLCIFNGIHTAGALLLPVSRWISNPLLQLRRVTHPA